MRLPALSLGSSGRYLGRGQGWWGKSSLAGLAGEKNLHHIAFFFLLWLNYTINYLIKTTMIMLERLRCKTQRGCNYVKKRLQIEICPTTICLLSPKFRTKVRRQFSTTNPRMFAFNSLTLPYNDRSSNLFQSWITVYQVLPYNNRLSNLFQSWIRVYQVLPYNNRFSNLFQSWIRVYQVFLFY